MAENSVLTMSEERVEEMSREEGIKESKRALRKTIIQRLGELSPQDRAEKSSLIQEKVIAEQKFKDARTVMAYLAFENEVCTGGIIEEALKKGKRVGVPYILSGTHKMKVSEIREDNRLEKGPLGIRQPLSSEMKKIPLEEIDLIIVPAIAYDEDNCMRLGRGKGFYDNFLSEAGLKNPATIGIAFSFQMVNNLPYGPHDRSVDKVITERSR